MNDTLTIVCNNVPRYTVCWYDLTEKEKKESYGAKLQELARKAGITANILTRGQSDAIAKAFDDARMRHYWYPAGKNGKNQAVYFCWTTRKDSTGHFRSWKETHTSTKIVRSNVAMFKTKRPAHALACARWNKYMGAK